MDSVEKNNKRILRVELSPLDKKGFGQIPKFIMMDRELSLTAKGIYLYLSSHAGGDTTFPDLNNILYHLNISNSTYYKYFKELTEHNYIIVEQEIEAGRFGSNMYYLNQNPEDSE